MENWIKKIIVLLIFYLYIFNPGFVFLPFSGIKLLYPIALYIFFKNKLRINRCFIFVNIIFILQLLYVALHELLFQNFVFLQQTCIDYIELVILPYFLVVFLIEDMKITNIYRYVYLTIGIAALCTLLMIFIPEFNHWVKYDLLKQNEYFDRIKNRIFGISEYLTFSYGILLASFAAYSLSTYLKGTFAIIACPFLLFSAVLNARVGFIAFFVCFLFLIINKKVSFSTFTRISIVFAVLLVIIVQILYEQYAHLIDFSFAFFYEIFDPTSAESTGSLNVLLNRMVVLPDSWWVFLMGSNENIYVSANGNSDIGYLIQLHYGGIIYNILLMLLPIYLFWVTWKLKYNYYICFLAAVVVLFIVNFKGAIFNSNPFYRLIMFIFLFETYFKYSRNEK